MEPPVVKDYISGRKVVDLNAFRRRLGLTAFDVWVAFLWRRNRDGHSFASARSISRFKNLPYTSVRRAIVKLGEMKLITDARWVKNEAGNKRFRRTIVGDFRMSVVTITKQSYEEINRKSTWGGAREGAGRPCKEQSEVIGTNTYIQVGTTSPDIRDSTYIQVGTTSIQDERTLKSMVKRKEDYIPFGDIMREDFAPSFSINSSDFVEEDSYDDDEIPPVLPASSLEPELSSSTPNQRTDKESPAEAILDKIPDSLAHNIQPPEIDDMKSSDDISSSPYIQVGQGNNPTIEKTVPMPPFPSTGLITVPKIPPPPCLSNSLNDEQCVKKLGEAYRGAYESRYGKRCYVMTRGSVKRSKFYKALVAAANFMRDNDIAPASWAAFSLDCWISFGEKNEGSNKKPPPVNWVFSMKRLEERSGWFDREASSYGGGRLLFTAKHKDLLRRYEELRRAAHKELLTEELIERFFPGGWERHYDAAKKEAAKDTARLLAMVKRGEFVW